MVLSPEGLSPLKFWGAKSEAHKLLEPGHGHRRTCGGIRGVAQQRIYSGLEQKS
jgi:hypothetical protein